MGDKCSSQRYGPQDDRQWPYPRWTSGFQGIIQYRHDLYKGNNAQYINRNVNMSANAMIKNWKSLNSAAIDWSYNLAPTRPREKSTSEITIQDLVDNYSESALQQLAVATILQALDRDNIVWKDVVSGQPDKAMEVPGFIHGFIAEAVRNLCLVGFIVYRLHNNKLELAGPLDVTLEWKGNKWVPKALNESYRSTRGWKVEFTDSPVRPLASEKNKEETVQTQHLRSGCVRSYHENMRLQTIEEHWLSRDMHNSRPAAFTTYSDALGSVNSSKKTWFRDNGVAATNMGARQLDVDQDFNELIQQRSNTIAQLDQAMAHDKQRITTAQQFGETGDDAHERVHAEHVVTDGRQTSETKTLVSLADSSFFYSRVRHNVLMLMGVPPQALGESVNSERTAANHKQYSTALALFDSTLKKVRRAISRAIGHTNALGTHTLGYHRCLTLAEIEQVAPLLRKRKAVEMYACAYDLPETFFDAERIREMAGGIRKPGERTITNHLKAGND